MPPIDFPSLVSLSFRSHGFTLNALCVKLLSNLLSETFAARRKEISAQSDGPAPDEQIEREAKDAVKMILNKVKAKMGMKRNVDEETLRSVVDFSRNSGGQVSSSPLDNPISAVVSSPMEFSDLVCVFNAFKLPRWDFLHQSNKWRLIEFPPNAPPPLLTLPSDKTEMMRRRMKFHQMKILQNAAFNPSAVNAIPLKNIQNLMGTRGHSFTFCLLSAIEEGRVFIEDADGQIELSLLNPKFESTDGVFVDGTFLLLEGTVKERAEIERDAQNTLRKINEKFASSPITPTTAEIAMGIPSRTPMGGINTQLLLSLPERELFDVFAIGFPPVELREETMKKCENLSHLATIVGGGAEKYGVKTAQSNLFKALANSQNASSSSSSALSSLSSPSPNNFLRSLSLSLSSAVSNDFPHSFVLFLSEIHLDNPITFKRIQTLFQGFQFSNSFYPAVIVLMGSFLSAPYGSSASTSYSQYEAGWGELIDVFTEFQQNLLGRKSTIIIIPGPNDPFVYSPLPKPPLPSSFPFVQKVSERFLKVIWASNPSRMQIAHLDVAVLRDNTTEKMKRNCLINIKENQKDSQKDANPSQKEKGGGGSDPSSMVDSSPSDEKDGENDNSKSSPSLSLFDHCVKTLIDQHHLSPLPLSSQPIHCNFDHALRLYPLPHVLVIGDPSQPCSTCYYPEEDSVENSCQIMNPGNFTTQGEFIVFFPATRKAQISKINNEKLMD